MSQSKADIIHQLQKSLLPLQGYKPAGDNTVRVPLGPVNRAFPGHTFPVGAVHEFISNSPESTAATCGFITGIASFLAAEKALCLWISARRQVFPPALLPFGLLPHQVVFIEAPAEKERIWVMEEALKCKGLAGVIAEVSELDFTASRRLQLAVEQSQVTGFIIRQQPRQLNTLASIARWHIHPAASSSYNQLPGIGFPRFTVQLDKIRNGKPGQWQLEWRHNRFAEVMPAAATGAAATPIRKIV